MYPAGMQFRCGFFPYTARRLFSCVQRYVSSDFVNLGPNCPLAVLCQDLGFINIWLCRQN